MVVADNFLCAPILLYHHCELLPSFLSLHQTLPLSLAISALFSYIHLFDIGFKPKAHTLKKQYSLSFMVPIMSAKKPNDENEEPHSSGYEGDISDDVSGSSTADTQFLTSRETSVETSDEGHGTEYGTIWIGCDARDAGPGVQNDDEAPFGTIWIGCDVRETVLDARQAVADSDEEPAVEHIEDISDPDEDDASNGRNGGTSSQ
ncbi:hypothetical protein BJX70DRAFT_76777 [Aspergillus crustosus]